MSTIYQKTWPTSAKINSNCNLHNVPRVLKSLTNHQKDFIVFCYHRCKFHVKIYMKVGTVSNQKKLMSIHSWPFPVRELKITLLDCMYFDDTLCFDTAYLKGSRVLQCLNLQRLGGLMSMTDKVGLSMSLPLLLIRLSSYSGVKMLLPLLVLSEWSVGLKLTGDRKLFPWVLLALGKVLRPSMIYREYCYATKMTAKQRMYANTLWLPHDVLQIFHSIWYNVMIMKFTELNGRKKIFTTDVPKD